MRAIESTLKPKPARRRMRRRKAASPIPFLVLQKLQQENADLKDKLLRTLADMENLRRRTEKEVADAKLYGVTSFARDMLTFADNLRRIVDNVPAELRESGSGAAATLVEGLELTERDYTLPSGAAWGEEIGAARRQIRSQPA